MGEQLVAVFVDFRVPGKVRAVMGFDGHVEAAITRAERPEAHRSHPPLTWYETVPFDCCFVISNCVCVSAGGLRGRREAFRGEREPFAVSAKRLAVTTRVADLWINRYFYAGRRFDNQTGLPEFVQMVRWRRPGTARPDADLFAAGGRHHPGDEIGGQ